MHTSLAVVAVTALLLAGCSDDPARPADDRPGSPARVALTSAERTDFLARVEGLGYTCREALAPETAYVACTRAGRHPDTGYDTVRLTAGAEGDLQRFSYCGPEAEVVTAFSAAFLEELGSPDLPTDVRAVDDATDLSLQECRSVTGSGIQVGGRGIPVLRELDLAATIDTLAAAGWSCRDDLVLSCTRGPEARRSVAMGAGDELRVAAPTPAALASATADLGLDPVVADAARDCRPDVPCDHLLVDGYDLTFDADAGHTRLRVRQTSF